LSVGPYLIDNFLRKVDKLRRVPSTILPNSQKLLLNRLNKLDTGIFRNDFRRNGIFEIGVTNIYRKYTEVSQPLNISLRQLNIFTN